MTSESAYRELGLERGAAADEVRRAYHRLLRVRKPEVDPEGFARLRAAYDVARAVAGEARLAEAPGAIVVPPPRAVPAAEPVDALTADAGVSPPIGAPPERTDVEPSPAPRVVGGAPLPDAAPMAAPAPADAPEAGLTPVQTLYALEAKGKVRTAAHMLLERLDASARDMRVGTPPFGFMVTLVLRLHEEERTSDARALGEAVARWLHATGAEVRVARGPDGVRWGVARELESLSSAFPRELRVAIARGAARGDLASAEDAARDLRGMYAPIAKGALAELQRSAPLLARTFAPALKPVKTRWTMNSWVLGSVLVGILRLVSTFASSSPSRPAPPPAPHAMLSRPWELENVRTQTNDVRSVAHAEGDVTAEQYVERLLASLDVSDWKGMVAAYVALRDHAQGLDGGARSPLGRAVAALGFALAQVPEDMHHGVLPAKTE